MNRHDKTWTRLASLARRTPEEAPGEPSPGFTTRVVARAFEARRRPDDFVFRFALRAFAVAAVLAIVCVATNFNVLSSDTVASDSGDDPVGELVAQL